MREKWCPCVLFKKNKFVLFSWVPVLIYQYYSAWPPDQHYSSSDTPSTTFHMCGQHLNTFASLLWFGFFNIWYPHWVAGVLLQSFQWKLIILKCSTCIHTENVSLSVNRFSSNEDNLTKKFRWPDPKKYILEIGVQCWRGKGFAQFDIVHLAIWHKNST